jgi:hypothetical protein
MGQLKNLTLEMARAVVKDAEQVDVQEVEGASMTILELTVSPSDMGRIIGFSNVGGTGLTNWTLSQLRFHVSLVRKARATTVPEG